MTRELTNPTAAASATPNTVVNRTRRRYWARTSGEASAIAIARTVDSMVLDLLQECFEPTMSGSDCWSPGSTGLCAGPDPSTEHVAQQRLARRHDLPRGKLEA